MSYIRCPHCQQEITLEIAPPHSTSARVDVPAEILLGAGYQPNPLKVYRTGETSRRLSLQYYYQHREAILAKRKAARLATRSERERHRALLWSSRSGRSEKSGEPSQG
jgi:hypothetical protein